MKLLCSKCDKKQDVVITMSGPHLKASCIVCRKYIKFINKDEIKQLEEEEDDK